jgi:hypothetical protein
MKEVIGSAYRTNPLAGIVQATAVDIPGGALDRRLPMAG